MRGVGATPVQESSYLGDNGTLPDNEHIETFFTDLRDTHVSGVGVKETSYYPYLSNLLNTIGKTLKPRVRCIVHPHSIGAGLPDGALITTDQKSAASDPLADGLIPSRVRIIGGLFYAYPADMRVPEVRKERLDMLVFSQPTISACKSLGLRGVYGEHRPRLRTPGRRSSRLSVPALDHCGGTPCCHQSHRSPFSLTFVLPSLSRTAMSSMLQPELHRRQAPGEIRMTLASIALLHQSQPNAVVRRVNLVLLGSEVTFRRLHRRVAQQQLNLLKFSAGGPAHFRATPPQVMRRNSGDARGQGVRLKQLPYNLFCHPFTQYVIPSTDRPQHVAFGNPCRPRPCVDGNLHPGRHR